jgi:Peptidase C13 family
VQSEAARFEQSQRSLLQAEVDGLAPSTKGATNVYAIGIAGWADQDVFAKELDGGLAALGDILPIKGRTLRLVNHRATLESLPLADQRNFAAAVHAIAEAMNKNEDVLLLLMTSHGEPTGFVLRLPNEVISELTPQEVAATLNKEGIKNRIVVVSACFAGIFVPPLANDDTIVLTAADAKNTSFGCAPERDWTYFGDAFFRQSVRPGRDLQHAFDNARTLIHGWELMDRAVPSNPQGHFGPALVAKLARFFESTSSTR